MVSMPLSFDEYLNAHYLWLVSIGRIPHKDFWCHYSASGLAIIRPFFQLIPESIFSIFALRFFGLCFLIGTAATLGFHSRRLRVHWLWGVLALALMLTPEVTPSVINFRTDAYAALAGILAMTIMFREPSPRRGGLATGLSVLSVIIMPKYVYPLTFALIAYLAYGYVKMKRERRSLLLSVLTGGAISLALAQGLLLTSGVWLRDDVYWSAITMEKFFIHCGRTETTLSPQLSTVVSHFTKYWWVAMLVLSGISGWLVTEWKRRGVRLWVGAAVIAGVAVYWGTCNQPWKQFLVPGLYCLALFVPYAARIINRPVYRSAATIILVVMATLMVFNNFRRTTIELASGSSFQDFGGRQEFLNHIPRFERVIGFYKTHPCFREDQTFVTWDEQWGNPKGFAPILPENSHADSCFQPGYLKKSLESSPPPASIALDSLHYPAGWNRVLSEYLAMNADLYVKAEVLDCELYIRKDLAR